MPVNSILNPWRRLLVRALLRSLQRCEHPACRLLSLLLEGLLTNSESWYGQAGAVLSSLDTFPDKRST